MNEEEKQILLHFINKCLNSKVWNNVNKPITENVELTREKKLRLKLEKNEETALLLETLEIYEDLFNDDWLPEKIMGLSPEKAKVFLSEIKKIVLNAKNDEIEKKLKDTHQAILCDR